MKMAGGEGRGPGQGSQVQGPGAARRAGAVQGEQCAGAGIGKYELGQGGRRACPRHSCVLGTRGRGLGDSKGFSQSIRSEGASQFPQSVEWE